MFYWLKWKASNKYVFPWTNRKDARWRKETISNEPRPQIGLQKQKTVNNGLFGEVYVQPLDIVLEVLEISSREQSNIIVTIVSEFNLEWAITPSSVLLDYVVCYGHAMVTTGFQIKRIGRTDKRECLFYDIANLVEEVLPEWHKTKLNIACCCCCD